MNLPAGLSVDSQNLTIQATLDWSSNIPPSASVPFVIGSGGFTIYQDNSSGNGGVIVYKDTPTPRTTTTRFPSSRSVVTLVSNSSGMKLFLNGTLIHSSGVASAGIVSGGYIGAYGSGPSLPFSGNLHELIVWNTALSDADVGSMATAAASAWNFALAPSKRVVFVGDSISEGLVAGAGKSWIRLLDLPQTACDIMKVVRSSITLTVQTASVSSWVDTFAGPNATLVLFCHTNDIYADGHTGAAVYTAFKNYANGRRAAGFGKIVGINILSRTNGGTLSLETERVAFNNALAADHSFLDAYIDVTTDANLGAPTAYSNPVYFGGDQTHPVLAGHAALAALAGPSIKALL